MQTVNLSRILTRGSFVGGHNQQYRTIGLTAKAVCLELIRKTSLGFCRPVNCENALLRLPFLIMTRPLFTSSLLGQGSSFGRPWRMLRLRGQLPPPFRADCHSTVLHPGYSLLTLSCVRCVSPFSLFAVRF